MRAVLTRAEKIALLNAMTAADTGTLDEAKVGLFSNEITPNDLTVLADLTEAAYTGYAKKSVAAWGAAFLDENGKPRITAQSLQFNPTASTATDTVRGYFVTNAAGDTLKFAVRLDEPVEMLGTTSGVIVSASLAYGE
ncbi:MAG: hypothetical protein ACRC33_29245 [Gemmataceae bacterium]